MEDFLNFDNILTGDEAASLFTEDVDETQEETPEKDTPVEQQEDETATEVNSETLFEEPESVGSEEQKDNKEKEDTASKEDGTSPNSNFYSSIASALKEEGVFPDLEEDVIEQITEPEDFRNLIEQQIHAGLHEAQKRIYEALNAGVAPNVIKQYESTLGYLNSITEDHINDESEQGEQLRKNLLINDFVNRGYSQERAVKMTNKLFDSGEDVEEAKQALIACKEFYGTQYQNILAQAKQKEEQEKQAMQKQAAKIRKDILDSDTVFGSVNVDKATRQKAYDNLTKPVYKDPNTGQYYTALQKYKIENEAEFAKNMSLLFTLTDGFKNIDKLVQPSAKKEVKKKLRELEHTLKNDSKVTSGNMKYVGTPASSTGTFFDNDFTIDMS